MKPCQSAASSSTQHSTQAAPAHAPSRTASQPADAIPLQLKHGAVTLEPAGAVLDALPSTIFDTQDISHMEHGAMVLGIRSMHGPTSQLDVQIGQLSVKRMLACARCKLWWMTPEWRTSTLQLPPETQFLLAELKGTEGYALLLPLIDGDFRATLRSGSGNGCKEGDLSLRVESGDKRVMSDMWRSVLYVAAGTDPFLLIERGVAAAARLSGGALPLSEKHLPPSLDVFGWCTWDAFYSTVSSQGIQEGLRSLNQGGIRPRTLIIDDGWQTTDVDAAFRKTPTTELAEQLHLRPEEQQLMQSMDQAFYDESMEVLADAVGQLPAGTPTGTLMPGLSNLGPEGVRYNHHYQTSQDMQQSTPNTDSTSASPAAPAQQEANKDAVLAVRLMQKLVGSLIGLGTAAFLVFYQWVVEPAAPGSWPVRFFAHMANGPLRTLMLSFYANASDFTRRLTSVRANGKFGHPSAGPDDEWKQHSGGLGEVVTALKQQFGLDYVYCWHGLPAYWAGVMPDSAEFQGLQPTLAFSEPTAGVLEVEPSMAWNPAVLAGVGVVQDPGKLYNSMHAYLSSSGVDGVKVDCQAGVGLVGSALGGGPALSRRFHEALEKSVRRHFSDNHCINCMCHSTENLYRMINTSVARVSDDFYPRDPASSHPHIAACVFNGLFMSVLVQPDWDMFHSKHVSAQLHAMARAVSGGAVYVSDKPGVHDFELLRRLVLPDGSVLRAQQAARPTRDCLFNDVLRDNKTLLKVWNMNPYNGVVGVFHLQGSSWDRIRRKFFVHEKQPQQLSTQVWPRNVEHLVQQAEAQARGHQQTYALYTFSGKKLHVLSRDEPMDLSLTSATGEVVAVSPVTEAAGVKFSPIGLCDMYNGGAAVLSCTMEGLPAHAAASEAATAGGTNGNGVAAAGSALAFTVSVRGCGRFLAYCSHAPSSVSAGGKTLLHTFDSALGAVHVDVPNTEELRCDLVFAFS